MTVTRPKRLTMVVAEPFWHPELAPPEAAAVAEYEAEEDAGEQAIVVPRRLAALR